jgi:uncharacterized protein (DUF934 family)
MRRILRRRELVEDEWRYWGEDGSEEVSGGKSVALIVPLAEFLNNIERWRAYGAPLGVRLAPPDAVEQLAGDIHRLSLVAAEFPGPGDGRGYSQARLLRSRFKFKGELRAVGAGVKQDLLFIMSRCGFDSFDLAPGQKLDEAIRALDRYSVAYQPAEPVPAIKQQRYFSGSSVPSNS